MPNVFREQAEDRFTRSLAFLNKAETLLQDDLVNRSALADAVSAIKNMLQGYLLLRIARAPESAVTQRWQETAASNSMPDLLQACGEAELDLRGLAVEIKALNRERNRRMHDDPGQRIETQQARHALELARSVQRRIKAAVEGKPVAVESAQSAPSRIATVMRAAVSGQLGRPNGAHGDAASIAIQADSRAAEISSGRSGNQLDGVPAQAFPAGNAEASVTADIASDRPEIPVVAPAQNGAAAETEGAAPVADADSAIPDEVESADEAQDTGDSGDTRLLAALTSSAPKRKRRRAGRVLARALLVAAVLLLGVVAGAGLMFPIATGHAPGWLAFATQYLPATPTATVAPTATTTAIPTPSGPFVAGLLVVTPSCASGTAAVTLTNSSAQPVRWSIGSPDNAGVLFATPGKGTPTPSVSGVLKGGASLIVSVSGSAGGDTLVVVASTGTVQLRAPTC